MLDLLLTEDHETAAEAALHLSYSMSLTPAIATRVADAVTQRLSSTSTTQPLQIKRKNSSMSVDYSHKVVEYAQASMVSSYTNATAISLQHDVWSDPSGETNRDVVLGMLKPEHRTGWIHHQHTGVVLPLSARTDHFTEPNRLVDYFF